MSTTLVWLTEDLRLTDNETLAAAIDVGQPLVIVYVLDDSKDWSPGGASRWWLHNSLRELRSDIMDLGGNLTLRRGDSVAEIKAIASEANATALFFARGYSRTDTEAESELTSWGEKNNVDVRSFSGRLIFEPEDIRTMSGTPYKVFTPFWRACLAEPGPGKPLKAPKKLDCVSGLASDKLDDWNLEPSNPDWAGGIREAWTPGERGAAYRLKTFLQTAVNDYATKRDTPSVNGTSQLSPHLHFGELSPRQVWHAVRKSASNNADVAEPYLRQLGWRDFSHHLLKQFPAFPEEPFRPAFKFFPWSDELSHLQSWQKGETGIPIVDAGMRELWHTGWMHNRVRMIAASFLVKNLLLPWQDGEAWFWDTLVDADLANNAAGWQWVAGSGADAAPYFRIFNPVRQGERFDKRGEYIRKWIPELASLPDKFIHQPWNCPVAKLQELGVQLGADYPEPIVDLSESRQRALDAYNEIRKS